MSLDETRPLSPPISAKRGFLRRAALLAVLVQVPALLLVHSASSGLPAQLPVLAAFLVWPNAGLWLLSKHAFPETRSPRWQNALFVMPFFVWFFACLALFFPAVLWAIAHGAPVVLADSAHSLAQALTSPQSPDRSAAWTTILRAAWPEPGRAAGAAGPSRLIPGVLLAGAVAWSAYGCLLRTRWVRTTHLEVAMPEIGPELDGFRIVQLSDLHAGNFHSARQVDGWVRRANRLEPDLVVVTGDLIGSGTHAIDWMCRSLSRLSARRGVLVTLGNHDYFTDVRVLLDALANVGLTVLRNEGMWLDNGWGGRLFVSGLDDTWTGRADLVEALRDWDWSGPAVLLAHDPRVFQRAAERGVQLVLAGHTHGGQMAIPFRPQWNLSARAYRYASGRYRQTRGAPSGGMSTLYVSRGLGTTGVPIRIGVAPEIVVVTLRCGGKAGAG